MASTSAAEAGGLLTLTAALDAADDDETAGFVGSGALVGAALDDGAALEEATDELLDAFGAAVGGAAVGAGVGAGAHAAIVAKTTSIATSNMNFRIRILLLRRIKGFPCVYDDLVSLHSGLLSIPPFKA